MFGHEVVRVRVVKHPHQVLFGPEMEHCIRQGLEQVQPELTCGLTLLQGIVQVIYEGEQDLVLLVNVGNMDTHRICPFEIRNLTTGK